MSTEVSSRSRRRGPNGVAAAILLLLATSCGGEVAEEGATAEGAVEGVPREELETQAEPMTLEEAERLGIVDTTIGLGDPANPDSVVPLDGPAVIPLDTAARLPAP